MEYRITFKNIIKNIAKINKHKWLVFKLCLKASIPFRGLLHDLSKYNPIEFFEEVKYTNEKHGAAYLAKKDLGYSKSWLHHIHKNKHHYEFWYDNSLKKQPMIPYKYTVEMICNILANGLEEEKKNWTKDYPLNSWLKERQKATINPDIDLFLTKIFQEVSVHGIDGAINKKNLKKLYKKYVTKD